jgi:hypothetical protein
MSLLPGNSVLAGELFGETSGLALTNRTIGEDEP